MPWAPLRSTGVVPLLKYHTVLNISLNVWMGSFNPQVWDKFPQDAKDVILSLQKSMSALCGATLTNEAEDVRKEMRETGHEFYEPTGAAREAFVALSGQPIIDSWLKDCEKAGIDGQALIDKLQQIAPKYKDGGYGWDDWWGLAGRVWLLEK